MSIPVALAELAAALAEHDFAYLLTAADEGGPHVVAVSPQLATGVLEVPEAGRRTRVNAAARPAVTLVWPPRTPGGYSLIVDGDAQVEGEAVTVTPRRAVRHRPAVPAGSPDAAAGAGGCGSDCVELPVATR